MLDYEHAPRVEDAFGFEPRARGGEVLRIDELPAFGVADVPLWMVQRRIARALELQLPSSRREARRRAARARSADRMRRLKRE